MKIQQYEPRLPPRQSIRKKDWKHILERVDGSGNGNFVNPLTDEFKAGLSFFASERERRVLVDTIVKSQSDNGLNKELVSVVVDYLTP